MMGLSKEEKVVISRLYEKGMTVPVISDMWPRPLAKSTVWGYLDELGVIRGRVGESRDKLIKLAKSGKTEGRSYRDIAKEVGCSHVYVWKFFNE
jgi:hypothetical protein